MIVGPSLNVRTLSNIGSVKEVIMEPKEPITTNIMKRRITIVGFPEFLLDRTLVINLKP